MPEDEQAEYRRKALAAIEAMREPLWAQIVAGQHKLLGVSVSDLGQAEAFAGDVWQAMIDAALSEAPQAGA